MAYALVYDYQKESRNEPRAYAGRIGVICASRDSADSALGRIKTRAQYRGDNRTHWAICAITGSLPVVGEEIMHRKITLIYCDF